MGMVGGAKPTIKAYVYVIRLHCGVKISRGTIIIDFL